MRINGGENQPIESVIRESIVLLIVRLISLELLFAFSFFLIAAAISAFAAQIGLTSIFSLYLLILLIFLIINGFLTLLLVLKWRLEYYQLRKGGISKITGILFKKEEKYACDFIEAITIEQSFFGRIFDYGTVSIYDPALKNRVYLINIPSPKKTSSLIEKLMGSNHKQEIPFVAYKEPTETTS